MLVREEIELAKAEVTVKVTSIARGAVAVAVGAVFGVFALIFVLGTIAWAINDATGDLWLGFAVVSVVLVAADRDRLPVRLAQAEGRRADADDGDRRGQEDPGHRHAGRTAPDAASRARSPEEIRASIEQNRDELGTAVEKLRVEVVRLTDWRAQMRPYQRQMMIGAGVAGFVLGGGIAALGALTFGRRRRKTRARLTAAQARNELGSPPAPSRPGPTWVPITGPISEITRGGTPKISVPRAASSSASLGRLDVLHHPGVGAVLAAAAQQVDHLLERALGGPHPLDRGDLGLDGEDRLDPQRRAQPRLGAGDPAAAPQVLERVDGEPHLQLRRGPRGRARPRRRRRRPIARRPRPPGPPAPRRRRRWRSRSRGRARPGRRADRGPARRRARCPTCRPRGGSRRSPGRRRAAARRRPGSRRSRAARWWGGRGRCRAGGSRRRSRRCRSRAGRLRASARTG